MTQYITDVRQTPDRPAVALIENSDRTEEHEAERPGQRWRYSDALAAARALHARDRAQARS